MNFLFIIFIMRMDICEPFFYPKIKICKIFKPINCNNYGTEYDLEMDKDETFFHLLNYNYSNANTTNSIIFHPK